MTTIKFEGKVYTLTSEAEPTSRHLPSNYTNYNDAVEGELYDFETSAEAIDENGSECIVYWIFENEKSENGKQLDEFDYDDENNIDRVVYVEYCDWHIKGGNRDGI